MNAFRNHSSWVLSLVIVGIYLFPSLRVSAQEIQSRTLKYDQRDRSFHYYVPKGDNPSKPLPVLFCLHGAGGNGKGQMKPFLKLATTHGFLLVGPDGIHQRWNAGCEDEIEATGNANDVQFIQHLLETLADDYRIDRSRVYVYGFSNGAALAHRLAVEIPEVITAISAAGAAMATITAESMRPGPPVSIQIMVGDQDAMFGTNGNLRGGTFHTATETANIWNMYNKSNQSITVNRPVPFTRWSSSANAAEVELWIVAGAGHTPLLSKTFHTAEQSWMFLSRQKKQAGQ